jgi:hypothetical protein
MSAVNGEFSGKRPSSSSQFNTRLVWQEALALPGPVTGVLYPVAMHAVSGLLGGLVGVGLVWVYRRAAGR